MTKTKLPIFMAALTILSGSLPARAEEPDVATQIVDVMNKVFGVHPGFRANHAKGVVVEGSFTATPEAAGLSRAAIFTGAKIPVTVRFSDSTGVPNIADGSPQANPHGIAIKYHLPDGSETDMVTNSLHFFPVATGEQFRDLLTAISQSPKDAAHPTALDKFKESHPTVAAALATVHTPDSFADEEYFGVNAFIFVNKAGTKQAVRYQITPEKLVYLDPKAAADKKPDFLIDELPSRLKAGPVTFHLKAQLAAPDDQTKDGSKPWPADRKVVDLGVLTIDKAVPDSLEAQKKLLFLPGALTDGIEQSDDPLVDTRDGAYAVSFSRRNP
ncbi:catalase family peroxidase [Methylocella tundrae]|uniref:Catalase-related peroxidase n=1 Tax=Methylocella tundrae TaxID=227605 RepID=A0A4U8Z0V7_METTU|nr:catalase family peroxidase [Methylocella tundrae]WPP06236.1 catalase family peroxidase [Methylocella tundrae]VFU08905.1 Catalase-related peroxidase [Methylocella tundrae]